LRASAVARIHAPTAKHSAPSPRCDDSDPVFEPNFRKLAPPRSPTRRKRLRMRVYYTPPNDLAPGMRKPAGITRRVFFY
jgi:hypothetical protein